MPLATLILITFVLAVSIVNFSLWVHFVRKSQQAMPDAPLQ